MDLARNLPFYPSEKYLKKGWAPEKIPVDALKALAAAAQRAQQTGVLSPSLAKQLLPNALVEGRFDDFGANGYGYPVTPERNAIFNKLGLSVGTNAMPPQNADWGDAEYEAWAKANPPKYDVHAMADKQGYGVDSDNPQVAAKMAAALLAEKASQFGEDQAIERWNGKGVKKVGGKTFADSENHVRKVEEMNRMLLHPKNRDLLDAYLKLTGAMK